MTASLSLILPAAETGVDNAMPVAGVEMLRDYMIEFRDRNA